jgi:DNA-binding winged helix-turn-helix (wHTH) protein/tetratricopeptide (TPR) repeat protein
MIYRAGPFEIDQQRCELRRGDARQNVQRKVLDAIVFLVEHRERVVTRSELTHHLWAEVIVSEGSLGTVIKEARQVLGDDGQAQRFILTVRGRGFRWIAPTELVPREGASEPRTAPPASVLEGRRIIGRVAELALVERNLDASDPVDAARLILIIGEAGIGKTRLAQAACASARARGVLVASARCDEIEGAPAHRPYKELLRTLAPEHNLSWSEAPDAYLRPEETRFRLFEDICSLIRERTRSQPAVLFLDDLHAADPFTLTLTAFLARELDGSGVRLLGTWREPELASTDPKQRWLLDLRRAPGCIPIQLAGLSRHESRELVHRLAPAATEGFVETLFAESRGNPFFLEEVVRAVLRETAPAFRQTDVARARSTALDTMIRERLGRLEDIARRLLDAACVLGQEFSPRIAEAAAELAPAECLDAWDQLEDIGIVRPLAGAPGEDRFVFTHGLVRASLEASLPRATRVGLHQRIAGAIAKQAPLSRYAWSSALAHHARRAVPALAADQAVELSVNAAREAVSRLAFEDGERHLAESIALLERASPASETTASAGHRARLYLELGDTQLAAGTYAGSRASFLEAVRLARIAGADDVLARAALGLGRPLEHILQPASDLPLVDSLRAALRGTGLDRALRVRLLGRLAIALHTATRDVEGARIGDQAVALAEEADDPDLIAYAQLARYWGMWGGDRLDETLLCTRAMAEHGARAESGHLAAWYALVHGALLLGFGRIDEARAQLRMQTASAARTQRPHTRAFVCMFEAMVALLEWSPESAERAMREWFSIATQLGDPVLANILFLMQLWPLRRQQGRSAELVPILRQVLAGWPSIGIRSMLASCLHDTGEADEARWLYDAAIAELETLRDDRASYYLVLKSLPELAYAFGDADNARRLLGLFEQAHGSHIVHPPGYQGPLARQLALLAATTGDRARARSLLDEAAAQAKAVGARWWVDRVRADVVAISAAG